MTKSSAFIEINKQKATFSFLPHVDSHERSHRRVYTYNNVGANGFFINYTGCDTSAPIKSLIFLRNSFSLEEITRVRARESRQIPGSRTPTVLVYRISKGFLNITNGRWRVRSGWADIRVILKTRIYVRDMMYEVVV